MDVYVALGTKADEECSQPFFFIDGKNIVFADNAAALIAIYHLADCNCCDDYMENVQVLNDDMHSAQYKPVLSPQHLPTPFMSYHLPFPAGKLSISKTPRLYVLRLIISTSLSQRWNILWTINDFGECAVCLT